MSIGAIIRRLFGPHEHKVSELYRAMFFDLDAYANQIAQWVPHARHILEVGCGEGAVTERLVLRYPDAYLTSIDITPRVGRLFRGTRERVSFAKTTVQEVAASRPGEFDVAIISDVIHHVPLDQRVAVLQATRRALATNGVLIFKEWERTASPIHWAAYGSDRWITGDRIRYLKQAEAEALLVRVFGTDSILAAARLRPWKNNLALLVKA